ncbi:aldo/keto reductase [Nonomuraea endophytica]|uniref:Aryl-alcohol dehydrogenase-like predicted oxidoreductase n=1 Tax=Nonomuraea endophytica TaxID=714136 RepID=A0A7W8A4N1_9ACTN|nr:aldo/keto reductase [Nonomuraea endophytica]MBB5079455.1 aryl-alcohol dehydrogenase-like predicted oxidoreductase [Nonomuraea endophytica]
MQAIADLRGWSPLVALQIEHNLIERTGERDLIPMAREMGLGVVPYSPPAGGVLTGKYSRADLTAPDAVAGDGTRRDFNLANGGLTGRNLDIADVVKEVAGELGHTPAQVGLAWSLHRPGVTASLIGARTLAQPKDNLGAPEVDFTPAQLARLDEVGAIELGFPHDMLASDRMRAATHGGLKVETRRR